MVWCTQRCAREIGRQGQVSVGAGLVPLLDPAPGHQNNLLVHQQVSKVDAKKAARQKAAFLFSDPVSDRLRPDGCRESLHLQCA